MATAFQSNAFQNNAFQIDGGAPAAQVQGVGAGIPWKDLVEAEFRKKHLQHLIVQEEKKLKTVEKKIKVVEKKVRVKRTDGILANLLGLEFRRDSIERRIKGFRLELMPVDIFLEEADVDDDDEEFLLLP